MTDDNIADGEESQDATPSSATIVCSDNTRNGKTLFAKLVVDLLNLRTGVVPKIFDTDNPDGGLLNHFPGCGEVVDILQTRQQLALFDGMLSDAGGHYVVDLSARHRKKFFDIVQDIGFEEGAQEAGLDLTVYFLIDRDEASVNVAAEISKLLPNSQFVTVRNPAMGDALQDWHVAQTYEKIRKDNEIVLPDLSAEALGMLEHPDFHFDAFIAGKCEHFPFEMKADLWGFLESLYAQR